MRGIQPDVLGSHRDIVMRTYLSQEKRMESMRLMAQAASAIGQGKLASDFIHDFVNLQWGRTENQVAKITETKYKEMTDYYMKHVRNLRPEMAKTRTGAYVVRGLEGLINNDGN